MKFEEKLEQYSKDEKREAGYVLLLKAVDQKLAKWRIFSQSCSLKQMCSSLCAQKPHR